MLAGQRSGIDLDNMFVRMIIVNKTFLGFS